MKNLLKTIFFILLGIVLFAAAGVGLYYLCLLWGYPVEAAWLGMGLLLVLAIGIMLARRIIVRRRQRRRIQQIVSLEHRSLEDTPQEKRLLENRWKRAVALLRTSYLGRFGNPLYALPWYMLIGKSGAGKSSAIRSSGLHALQTDVGPDPDSPQTRNCDWWFFREAVVLDTAGRYAVPENEAADSAEWREFLGQLAKHRRREPLNGLVIVVAADALLEGGARLTEEARCLRRRTDEIMRILGARFPVYLMVTKIDLPAGMARVLEGLPLEWKAQCAGKLMQSPERKDLLPVAVQIKKALQEIMERIRTLCLHLPVDNPVPAPHRLVALAEMRALVPALSTFAEELFAENAYQETPLLRGIFFSSALHGDAERPSGAFPALKECIRRVIHAQKNVQGTFLHDFFGLVLPRDRYLYRPIAEYLRWRSSVRVLAYALMLLVTFGVGTLLSLSFQHNESALRQMESPQIPFSQGMASRVFTLERLYRNASHLDETLFHYRLPAMGLNHAKAVHNRYNDRLNEIFEREVYTRANAGLSERRSRVTLQTPDAEYAMLIADLIWRYDMISAVEKGADAEDLLRIPAMPQGMLTSLGLESIPSLAPTLAYNMAQYYSRQQDSSLRQQSLRAMRASLVRLPPLKGYSLQWLTERISSKSDLPSVRGGLFWAGSVASTLNEVRIDPAYTVAGFKEITNYITDLERIVGEEELDPHVQAFQRWYAGRYVDAWKNYAAAFTRKVLELATTNAVSDYMPLMASEQNPFFLFALRMDEELRPIVPYLDSEPNWIADLALWSDAMRLARKNSEKAQETHLAERLRGQLGQARDTFNAQFDIKEREHQMRTAALIDPYQAYLAALNELVRFTAADEIALQAVKSAMPDPLNNTAAAAPVNIAQTACLTLQGLINTTSTADSPVTLLTESPLAFFMDRLVNQTSCQIQSMWEENVLSKVAALSPIQLQQALFAEQGGLARQFSDSTMTLFLRRSLFGYQSQKLGGRFIPFKDDFLHFLNEGTMQYTPAQQEYAITINAIPVDVNNEAIEKPYAVILSLNCAREMQELANYNSPSGRQFVWQQGLCGDTRLSVRFKTTTLDILYPGEQGFVQFLHDFQYGTKTFPASQFPDHAQVLKGMGVTDITLRYAIAGADALLRSTTYVPGTLPFVITECRR